jgi:hypothetical protein
MSLLARRAKQVDSSIPFDSVVPFYRVGSVENLRDKESFARMKRSDRADH